MKIFEIGGFKMMTRHQYLKNLNCKNKEEGYVDSFAVKWFNSNLNLY